MGGPWPPTACPSDPRTLPGCAPDGSGTPTFPGGRGAEASRDLPAVRSPALAPRGRSWVASPASWERDCMSPRCSLCSLCPLSRRKPRALRILGRLFPRLPLARSGPGRSERAHGFFPECGAPLPALAALRPGSWSGGREGGGGRAPRSRRRLRGFVPVVGRLQSAGPVWLSLCFCRSTFIGTRLRSLASVFPEATTAG